MVIPIKKTRKKNKNQQITLSRQTNYRHILLTGWASKTMDMMINDWLRWYFESSGLFF